jgi:hypothetical protein
MVMIPEISGRLVVAVPVYFVNPLRPPDCILRAEKELGVTVRRAVSMASMQVGNEGYTIGANTVLLVARQAVCSVQICVHR